MWFLVALIVVAIALGAFVFLGRNLFRPKLSAKSAEKVLGKLRQAASQGDAHRRLLEADSVLDLAFTELGFTGSLGEKLKKAGKYLPNEDALWKAHKLRNRIAHESGIHLNEQEVAHALQQFEKAIRAFIR